MPASLQESEDAVKTLAKEKDMLEREKWDLRRQSKEATEQANILRSQLDMKENRIKELEAELTMVRHPALGHSRAWLNEHNHPRIIIWCVAGMQTRLWACHPAAVRIG